MSGASRILIGLVAGAVTGVIVNLTAGDAPALQTILRYVTDPLGRIWLNGLVMVVIPLVFATLASGVAGLGSIARLGRIGGLSLLCFLGLTAVAAALGLLIVGLVQPGAGLDADVRDRLAATYSAQSRQTMGLAEGALSIDTIVAIVPRNPVQAAANGEMLAVIFFALMVGAALAQMPRDLGRPMLEWLDSLGRVMVRIIEFFMALAPYAVACLVFGVTARFGLDVLASLAAYVVTVAGGLLLFLCVVYPIALAVLARRSPVDVFRRSRLVLVTAFSTSSSSATLPTTLRVAQEELRVRPEIAGFVIPLGATLNMNGTALFEGVTVLFIAQVFGIELGLGQQVLVVAMSVVTAIGTAGVPGGSIPLLMMVLGMVGVPAEGIALVLGVDRFLDMCRTTINVAGDVVSALVVDRFDTVR